MFKRKKQVTSHVKTPPPLPPPPPSLVHRKKVVKLTIGECLQQAQGALQKLRTISPGDIQAFPLLNETQRLVQQLKEATASLPPADRDAWSYQIGDLEDEFRELADMVVARADAAPKPEPRLGSAAPGGSNRSSMTSALISPSSSGRVQQAVAMFSRQDGFTSGTGMRRAQITSQPQRQQQQTLQQEHPQVQKQVQRSQLHHQEQYQEQYLQPHSIEQAYPKAASSAMSTPARSDSSFMYLTEEERDLLAIKQQALLQKHFKYLAQQREAEEQGQGGATQGALAAPLQQIGSTNLVQQQHVIPAQQHTQASLQALYHQQQQQDLPSQAGPHALAVNGAVGLTPDRLPVFAATAPKLPGAVGTGRNATAAAIFMQQQHQGLHPGTQPNNALMKHHGGADGSGGTDDDLFSGLDIVATEEQRSLPQAPTQAEVQTPAVGAAATAASTGVQATCEVALGDATTSQQTPTYTFRSLGHAVPHRIYDDSQTRLKTDNGASPQEPSRGEPSMPSDESALVSYIVTGSRPLPPSNEMHVQFQQLRQNVVLPSAQQQWGNSEQVQHLQYEAPKQEQYLQHPHVTEQQLLQYSTQRQHSVSAQAYPFMRQVDEMGSNADGVLTSSRLEMPGNIGPSVYQAPEELAAETTQVASLASNTSSVSYTNRKKTAHVKVGYGLEEASSHGQQPQQQATLSTSAGVHTPTGNDTVEPAVSADAMSGTVTRALRPQQQLAPVEYYPQQDGSDMSQGPWAHQGQVPQPSRPTTPAYATLPSSGNQGKVVPGPSPKAPQYDSQYAVYQQLQQHPFSPPQVTDADAGRYPHAKAQENVHNRQPALQLQQPAGVYVITDSNLTRNSTESAKHTSQQVQLSQDPPSVQLVQPAESQPQPIMQQQYVQSDIQSAQHLQKHTEQHTQYENQHPGQPPSLTLRPQPSVEVRSQHVWNSLPSAMLPTEVRQERAYYLNGLPPNDERGAISGNLSAKEIIASKGWTHAPQPQQPATRDATEAIPAGVSTKWTAQPANGAHTATSGAPATTSDQNGRVVSNPIITGGTAPAASSGDADAALSAAASRSTASAPSARPNTYASAFLLHSLSGMDRGGALPIGAMQRPLAAVATTPSLPSSSPVVAETVARSPSAVQTHMPERVVTTTTAMLWPQTQPSSATDISTPLTAAIGGTSVLSLPLSSSALKLRSRGFVSGGGSTNTGGLGVDPAASLPVLSSLPNIIDLEDFLNNITGPVDACRAAAEHRAQEMLSALASALSQAQKVEASVQQQRRAIKAGMAGVLASIAHLESDQAVAVESEEFEAAAALDEQLTQLTHRRASMEEQVRHLADALQRAAALRVQVRTRQAEVCRTTGAYLARLQSGQQEMAATLASQADREAQAAAMLHRVAQEELEKRRGSLEERKAELETASENLASQVAAATAPGEAERQRRASIRDALQADVESIRALLTTKEAALAAAEAAVVEAAEVVRQQARVFDPELGRLENLRTQLEMEAAKVASHEQALQNSERQAEARAEAVSEHQSQLRLQADALGTAAAAMRTEAEALMQRVAVDVQSQEQRERLLHADEKAREDLEGLERCISDLTAEIAHLAEQRVKLAAERASAQETLAGFQRSLPELEAAKRAAAASKDFREAARLSGELRALTAQADVAAAQLARLSGAMSELAAFESGKVLELEELRTMVHEAQRHAAEAHHRYLVFSLGLNRSVLEEAVAAELYEEAGALQAEVAAEEAEVMTLERTWGIVRPQLPGQASALTAASSAPSRRRTSLEATPTSVGARFSRQSLGSLSAQSSRSLSSQLPASIALAVVGGLKNLTNLPGASTLHTGSTTQTGPTSSQQSLPQPHLPPSQLQQHHHQYLQQQSHNPSVMSPVSNSSCTKLVNSDIRVGSDGDCLQGTGLVAAAPLSPTHPACHMPVSPILYVVPPPQSPSGVAPSTANPSVTVFHGTVPHRDDLRVVTTGASPVNDSVLAGERTYSTSSRTSIEGDSHTPFTGPHSPQRPASAVSPRKGAEGVSHEPRAEPCGRVLATEAPSMVAFPSHQPGVVGDVHEVGADAAVSTGDESRGEARPRASVPNGVNASAVTSNAHVSNAQDGGDLPEPIAVAATSSDAPRLIASLADSQRDRQPFQEQDRQGWDRMLRDNPLYQREEETSGRVTSISIASAAYAEPGGGGGSQSEPSKPVTTSSGVEEDTCTLQPNEGFQTNGENVPRSEPMTGQPGPSASLGGEHVAVFSTANGAYKKQVQ